ncbi:DUF1523 family protein [Paracoccaceae bacterium Fryx2]|nr:DUF1523 family protein [Paracoccaceae bacterium Fryx2]
MWVYIKWGFRITLLLIVGGFLHYTLPQRDVMRITNTYNRVTTVGENWMFFATPDAGTAESSSTRDVRFIETVGPDDKVMVYRNEDTGWIWPPYFKYDSSNLQAEASNLQSTKDAPEWVAVTHYGWRVAWLSIYPNAVKVKPVEGPDVTLVNWVSILVLTCLAIALFMLRRMWMQFRERTIDPALEEMGDAFDAVEDRADAARKGARTNAGRFRAWLRSWGGPTRR